MDDEQLRHAIRDYRIAKGRDPHEMEMSHESYVDLINNGIVHERIPTCYTEERFYGIAARPNRGVELHEILFVDAPCGLNTDSVRDGRETFAKHG